MRRDFDVPDMQSLFAESMHQLCLGQAILEALYDSRSVVLPVFVRNPRIPAFWFFHGSLTKRASLEELQSPLSRGVAGDIMAASARHGRIGFLS